MHAYFVKSFLLGQLSLRTPQSPLRAANCRHSGSPLGRWSGPHQLLSPLCSVRISSTFHLPELQAWSCSGSVLLVPLKASRTQLFSCHHSPCPHCLPWLYHFSLHPSITCLSSLRVISGSTSVLEFHK